MFVRYNSQENHEIWKSHFLTVVLIFFAIFGIIQVAISLPSRSNKNDFAHYYLSSRMLLAGENPYQAHLSKQYDTYGFVFDERIYQATNPPTLVWLFSPLARLAPRQAFLAWAFIQAMSLLAILVLLRRLLDNQITVEKWWFICAMTLASAPVYYNFYYSQVQLLLAALVLSAYLLQKYGKHQAALLTITATGMMKLFPLVLVPWFIWRAPGRLWRKGLYVLEALLLAGAIVYLTGPALWADFLRYGSQVINENIVNRSFNFSFPSFIINLAYVWFDFCPPQDYGSMWYLISVVVGIAITFLGYIICYFGRSDYDIQFSILCITMIIGGITAWGHYLVFLIFPLALGYVVVSRKETNRPILLFGFILVLLLNVGAESSLMGNHIVNNILINYIPLYAMLLLVMLLSKELLKLKQVSL